MDLRKHVVKIAGIITLLSFQFCKKQTDSYTAQSYKQYYPLTVGKYMLYRLDSLVFVDFDSKQEIHSYQAKDLVDEEMTDNIGRKSFRIRRMIRNLDGTGEWRDIATFMATPLDHSLEYVEENQRYIRLKDPVREGFYWDGNSYIDLTDELSYLQFWDYNYKDVGQAFSTNDTDFNNTITVLHVDESSGDVELFPNSFASKDYSVEVYSKDLGLVYKDLVTWTYQATPVTSDCRALSATDSIACPVNFNCDSLAAAIGGYVKCDTLRIANAYSGFGIKLSILDHN